MSARAAKAKGGSTRRWLVLAGLAACLAVAGLTNAGCTVRHGGSQTPGKGKGKGTGSADAPGPKGGPTPMVLAAGTAHTCVLRESGSVACWGTNDTGQLGDGTKTDRSKAVTVQNLTDAKQLALGESHSCALRRSGAVSCWGANDKGQLGSGNDVASPRPVAVRGLSDAIAIAAGDDHTCAARATGAVVCWGNNRDGQLGNLTRNAWTEPAPIRGLADAVGVVAGARHSCALRATGGAICWGANDKGQLGDSTTKGHERPSAVADLAGLQGLAAAGARTCGFTAQAVFCWGELAGGQAAPRPQKAADGSANDPIVEVELGPEHACLRHQGGAVRCWGQNRDGRLGDGTFESRGRATKINLAGALDLALGARHGCALLTGGRVSCWGDDTGGALGRGDDASAAVEPDGARLVARLDDAVDLSAGDGFSCATRKSGEVVCWGRNDQGQLGDASPEPTRPMPGPVFGIDDGVAVAAGASQACAVRQTGGVVCWGVNDKGQLGRAPGAPLVRPSPIPKLDDATAVSLGAEHGCALRKSGEVYCWGNDAEGQLGDGAGDRGGRVSGLSDAVALSSGRAHTCALRRSGAIMCWGANNQGQIGNSVGAAQLKVPVQVPTPVTKVSDASEIAMGPEHGCARKRDGKVVCWGRNSHSQLGSGTASEVWTSRVPVKDLSNVSALAVGPVHACAAMAGGGRIACWGDNEAGQGGFAGASASTPRVGVQGLDVAALALGRDHTCARLRSGAVSCWGSNERGQLGDGGRILSPNPAEVQGL